ncbi:unnamed protein product [Moneuplotes crassus]|uniref:Uncharacterized protein n=1 Tax=Euplotes crassus TaxID=5936 RepID=A0AAD1UAB1_EUPCR|nr:unnamed protein product [Moneuplotes crassus]
MHTELLEIACVRIHCPAPTPTIRCISWTKYETSIIINAACVRANITTTACAITREIPGVSSFSGARIISVACSSPSLTTRVYTTSACCWTRR